MRAFIFTSKIARGAALIFSFLLIGQVAWADGAQQKKDRSLPPEEDDFSSTPFTEYGSFNEDEEEAAEEAFFQNGRLFGVSIGVGTEGATGNRGQLWQGGFPMVELKVHYWFDFHLAMDLGFTLAQHTFPDLSNTFGSGTVTVNTSHIGLDIKYYFDVKNLSAPISFANPYVLLGVGAYSESLTDANNQGTTTSYSAFAVDAGVGLEFVIKPKKIYFEVEGKVMSAQLGDTSTQVDGLSNLNGLFYTVSGGLLFTW